MAGLVKKVSKSLKQAAKQTLEAIKDEPGRVLESAAQQTGFSAKGEKGVEKPQGGGLSSQQQKQLEEREKKRRAELVAVRRHLKEINQEQLRLSRQRAEEMGRRKERDGAQKAQKIKQLGPPPQIASRKKRGTALLGARKKGKGSGEVVAAKRSK
jgi:hypothetical protein